MSAWTDDDPLDRSQLREIVVAGAGLAATQTVAALREGGFDGRVVVLGAEGIAPYDRPPLSKHLLDRRDPTWLTDEIGVDLLALADEVHLGTPARGLSLADAAAGPDRRPHVGRRRPRGSHRRARRPTPGWEAALTLHTATDAQRLRDALVPGARLVVIGAGWIGAEVAGIAAAAGVEVVVVEAAGAPLSGALGASVGELVAPWYAAAGVRLLTGEHVVEVGTNGVLLADGKLVAADIVLAAVGARPTTDWLAGALPREADGSLRVDEHHAVLGASRSVRAVGDVALRRSPRHGWVPGGHWDGALRGPAALVADLLGTPHETVDVAPYVFSTQLGHELALFGQPHTDHEVVLRGDPAGDGWAALWFRRGADEVAAILTVDRPRDVGAARRLFTGARLPRLDRSLARDPGRALREAALA